MSVHRSVFTKTFKTRRADGQTVFRTLLSHCPIVISFSVHFNVLHSNFKKTSRYNASLKVFFFLGIVIVIIIIVIFIIKKKFTLDENKRVFEYD